VVTTPSLGAAAQPDYTRALEVADTVSIFGVPGTGRFYATSAMSPTVSRYEVSRDGATITPGPVLSFARLGVGAGYSTRSVVFLSSSLAYLLDDTTLKAISFDPEAMTIGHAVDLSALLRPGYRTNFAYNIPVRGGSEIVVTALYYDASYSHTLGETALALIDTATDAVTVTKDTRCGTFSTVATMRNGDLYFGPDTYAAAIHRVAWEAAAPTGCLLRMKSGESRFDPSYLISTSALVGGAPAGGAVTDGQGGLYLRVLDERLYTVTDTTSATTLLAAPAWRWWRIDAANSGDPGAMATEVAFDPGAGEVKSFVVDGAIYTGDASADYQSSRLVELGSRDNASDGGAPAAPVAGLSLQGYPSGVLRVY
jgi:hypothetical protein